MEKVKKLNLVHNLKVGGIIDNIEFSEGRLIEDGENFHICQNRVPGADIKLHPDYKHSWLIGKDEYYNDLVHTGLIQLWLCSDLEPGKIISKDGKNYCIISITGDVVLAQEAKSNQITVFSKILESQQNG